MLNITENLLAITGINISCTVADDRIIKTNMLAEIMLKAIADAIVVGGIVFFSTLASIGYQNLNENLYTALLSSTMASGLSFFTDLRKNKKKIWVHSNGE